MAKKAKVAIIKDAAPVGDETPKETSTHKRAVRMMEIRSQRTAWPLEARLAGDIYCLKNVKLPAMMIEPWESNRMQFCDFMFPHADGGPLFIDRARDKFDEKVLKEKSARLAGSRIRYMAIPLAHSEEELLVELERFSNELAHGGL